MPNDLAEVENELRSVLQEKRRVEEHIREIQQQISHDETWLERSAPATAGYQETLEELLALQPYVDELHAQVACLDEVALELVLERESWYNPDLLPAS
jgi:predicted  nucleic acid-binding Zn-ribbon protein